MKKVSIITTFYNAQDLLLHAVNSINQQVTHDEFKIEYVLVDDKSTDNSLKVLTEFIENFGNKKDIEFRIISPEKNLGCGGARKFGIDNATGDYYMFLDADDYYLKIDFVYRAYKELTENNADIVEYGIIYNNADGTKNVNTVKERIEVTNPHTALLLMFQDNAIKFNVWSKIYTKEIIKTYPYSSTRTFEDVRTTPIWLSNAKKVIIMPTAEINYRATSNSIIRTNMVETRLGTIGAIAELFENFKNDKDILKAMYTRSMIDLEALLMDKSSNCEGFNEMSRLNTKMLSYIYPNSYKDITYHIEDIENKKQ